MAQTPSAEEQKKVNDIMHLLDNLANDASIPRNVRKTVTDVREQLLNEKEDLSVRVGTAIYSLEESAEDVNIPMHARTQLWAILSALESIKIE